MKPKALTYYADIGNKDDEQLVQLWQENWTEMGWDTVICGPAQESDLTALVKTQPTFKLTVNGLAYEQACWLRWVAWSDYTKGICDDEVVAVCDYDIINRKLTPEAFWTALKGVRLSYTQISVLADLFHGFAFAPGSGLRAFVRAFLFRAASEYPFAGDPLLSKHVSDMTFLWTERFREYVSIPTDSIVHRGIGDPGWINADLIHLCNENCVTRTRLFKKLRYAC